MAEFIASHLAHAVLAIAIAVLLSSWWEARR